MSDPAVTLPALTAGTCMPDDLLTVETVGPYIARRGLVARGTPLEVRALGGGVSNVVLAVSAGELAYVVKQSLPRLRVAEEWLAKRERILTEADALRWTRGVTPDAVPTVCDVDEVSWSLIIARAPTSWQDWKTLLLAGEVDPAVAARLGAILATWHAASWNGERGASRFDDSQAFDQLRVDPYYRTVMARHPDLASAIAGYVARMEATHCCLVHGDFSPKNVLLGHGGLWVVDFEVAHLGDPAFDLAFMLNHLMLKAIHRPACRDAYWSCTDAFWRAYHESLPGRFPVESAYVYGHVGCLMLARVDGKSPAEYLTPPDRAAARTAAHALLASPPATPSEAWTRLDEAVAR